MLAMFCYAMRRDVYDTVGPLDERYGLGLLEDDDYATRLRAAGYRLVSAEDVFVHHFGEASFGRLFQSGDYQRLLRENKTRYAEKWGTPWRPYARRTAEEYEDVIEATRRAVRDAVPPDSPVLMISRGDDRLLDVDDRVTWHFPRDADGVWAGHYPADSETAVSLFRNQIEAGARYLVVPRTASGGSSSMRAQAPPRRPRSGDPRRYDLQHLPVAESGGRRPSNLAAAALVAMGIHVTQVDLGEQPDESSSAATSITPGRDRYRNPERRGHRLGRRCQRRGRRSRRALRRSILAIPPARSGSAGPGSGLPGRSACVAGGVPHEDRPPGDDPGRDRTARQDARRSVRPPRDARARACRELR